MKKKPIYVNCDKFSLKFEKDYCSFYMWESNPKTGAKREIYATHFKTQYLFKKVGSEFADLILKKLLENGLE